MPRIPTAISTMFRTELDPRKSSTPSATASLLAQRTPPWWCRGRPSGDDFRFASVDFQVVSLSGSQSFGLPEKLKNWQAEGLQSTIEDQKLGEGPMRRITCSELLDEDRGTR